jgi:hypothetical protein
MKKKERKATMGSESSRGPMSVKRATAMMSATIVVMRM